MSNQGTFVAVPCNITLFHFWQITITQSQVVIVLNNKHSQNFNLIIINKI